MNTIPDISFFLSNQDSLKLIEQKQKFHSNFKSKKWNFKKELIIFNDQKLVLLMICCLNFFKEALNLQDLLKEKEKINNKELLNPFGYPLCSLSGFVFKLFKLFFLN